MSKAHIYGAVGMLVFLAVLYRVDALSPIQKPFDMLLNLD